MNSIVNIIENEGDMVSINDLLRENDELRQNFINITLQLQNWEEEMKILSMKYRAREEDVDTLYNIRSKLINKNNYCETKINNLESENDVLKNVIKKQIEYDEIEIIKLNNKIANLNNKVYKLTSENIKLTNENKKIIQDFENEKNELICMHNEEKSELDFLIDILFKRNQNEKNRYIDENTYDPEERLDEFDKLYNNTICYFELILFPFAVYICYFLYSLYCI